MASLIRRAYHKMEKGGRENKMRGGEGDKARFSTMDNSYHFLVLYLICNLMLFYKVKNIEYKGAKS